MLTVACWACFLARCASVAPIGTIVCSAHALCAACVHLRPKLVGGPPGYRADASEKAQIDKSSLAFGRSSRVGVWNPDA